MSPKAFVRPARALSYFLLLPCLSAQLPDKPAPKVRAAARDWTLADFRRSYLNQRILILQGTDVGVGRSSLTDVMERAGLKVRSVLGGWEPVNQAPDGSFIDDHSKGGYIDFKYKDQTPRIVAIREDSVAGTVKPKEGQKNAMGKTVSGDDIVNPDVEVIVQFDDGQMARYTNIVSNIRDRSIKTDYQAPDFWDMEFMLVSLRDAHAETVARGLPGTIGQKVYAVHDSLLFGVDITPEDLLDLGRRTAKQLTDVPLLTPMTIVAATYNDRYDFIVWELRLDDGREVISASRYRDEDVSKNGNDNSFLGRGISTLLLKVPSSLTPQEIAAIRGRKIVRGMTRQAVLYSWGLTHENNYGKGGKQLVYGGNQFVYLDNSGRVTDWQSTRR